MTSDIIIANNEAELQNISDYYFDKLIYDMEYIVEKWANSDFIKNYHKPDNTKRIVSTIPEDFDEVYQQWLGLSHSMHDITWMYYALESDGSIYIAPVDVSMPSDYDARTRDWYKGTVSQSGEIYWTEPYIDAGASGKVLQTVSKAVYKNGQLQGVIGLDIELHKFTEIIETLSFAKSSSIFLINQSNSIIAHNSNDVSFYEDHFISQLKRNDMSELVKVDNMDYVVSSVSLNINDWKLIAITETDFRNKLSLMRHQMILIILVTSVISIIFAYMGFRNILSNLKLLIDTTEQYSNGQFQVRSHVNSNDEFKTLSSSMNNMLDSIETLIEERDSNYLHTVKVLANAIEASDQYTRGHCDRVGLISLEIGKRVGLDEEDLKQLEFACILHDIGKIAIPERILNKPSSLTEDEFMLIKSHPQVGHDILRDIHYFGKAKQIILQHHEKIDGSGYPYGLTAKDICLEAKILAVADAYDAMSSKRVYRIGAFDTEDIIKELRTCSGTQFDPTIVTVMIGLLKSDVIVEESTS
jgi:putative nucleotidyltransferase with HDIG domain